MTSLNMYAVGVAGVMALSLHGCGGGGGTTPSPGPPATTQAPVTTTTTEDVCAHAHVVPKGEDELVDWLNDLYTGFDADDPTSPSGVTIRVADNFEMFCGTGCHQGYPDCRVSSSLYNSKMLYMHDTYLPAITMGRDAGIVYNQTTVEAKTGKCVYMYDGATFNRVNRGCGCAARRVGCGEQGAYWNQDCQYGDRVNHQNIDLSTCHNNTEISEDVQECWCKFDHLRPGTPSPEDARTIDQQCFFRAGGLYPPHPLASEFHDAVKARIANQESGGGTEVIDKGDGTFETRYKSEYWNEVVVDAEVLEDMLMDKNVTSTDAVSAFMYVEGGAGKQKALDMQLQVLRDYGSLIPIVAFDKDVDLRCSGPFRKATDLGPPPDPCAAPYQECTGGICCQDGLVCVENNPYYSNCQPAPPPTTTITTTNNTHLIV